MSEEKITRAQAENALTKCGGIKRDQTDNRIAVTMIQHAVAEGENGYKIAELTRSNSRVGWCIADQFGLGQQPTWERVAGVLTKIMNDAASSLGSFARSYEIPEVRPTTVTIHNARRTDPDMKL